MKKIKSFYYEIVISKIYMLEKYKREFDEGNIYNGIWGTLQTLFVFTACIILFILVHIYRTPQYKVIPIFFYPIIIIAFLKLITVIF